MTLEPTGSRQDWIIDVDVQAFTRDVADRSREVPVLVDLWAEWCGPCKTLGPMLERLAQEDPGRFVLAKVDVDRAPELMEVFGLSSVPACILFVDGRPVDAFVGALPDAELRAFLDKHIGPAQEGEGDVVSEARELFAAGDAETAFLALEAEAGEADGDPRAGAVLAELLLESGDADRAREVFEALGEASRATSEAGAVAARLALGEQAGDVTELHSRVEADPKDLDARVALGKALVASGENEAGLEQLYEACLRDMHHDDDAPRKAIIEVFAALGTEDPLVVEYQQRLSVLLCS